MAATGASAQYEALREAVRGAPLPAALIDLDAVDHNIEVLTAPVRAASKTLRLATKSIRCVELLRYIAAQAPGVIDGLMAYSVREAAFLLKEGFRDILVAYPTVLSADAELLVDLSRSHLGQIKLVVDDEAQVQLLAQAARARGAELSLVIEVDASFRPAGLAHLGVRRSPIHTASDALRLAQAIARTDGATFGGVMMYEAQIAGLGDASDFKRALNPAKAILRRLSRGPVASLRAKVKEALLEAGFSIPLFNGGGTGSLHWASGEASLTEVTAGSGFLASHLFDYYAQLELKPAAFFALQVARRPAPTIVTCHGGGYVASGEAGQDRLPRPFYPAGLKLLDLEGAGEVQTPLQVPPQASIELGSPIFFRHAKAGELAEHFNHYRLLRGDGVERQVPTYRGQGQAFL